jgi:hypothetical protein
MACPPIRLAMLDERLLHRALDDFVSLVELLALIEPTFELDRLGYESMGLFPSELGEFSIVKSLVSKGNLIGAEDGLQHLVLRRVFVHGGSVAWQEKRILVSI